MDVEKRDEGQRNRQGRAESIWRREVAVTHDDSAEHAVRCSPYLLVCSCEASDLFESQLADCCHSIWLQDSGNSFWAMAFWVGEVFNYSPNLVASRRHRGQGAEAVRCGDGSASLLIGVRSLNAVTLADPRQSPCPHQTDSFLRGDIDFLGERKQQHFRFSMFFRYY